MAYPPLLGPPWTKVVITDSPAEDIYLDGMSTQSDIDVLFALALKLWPEGTLQYADETDNAFTPMASATTPPVTREFILVKNDEARRAWDTYGYTDAFAGTLLFIQPRGDYIAITTDGDATAVGQALLDAVKNAREARGVTSELK